MVVLVLGWALAQLPDGPPGSAAWWHSDLHARYATARLRLAETRLEKAERLNARTPGEVTAADLLHLRSRVELLRDELEATREQPHGYGFTAQRRAARSVVQLAEQEVQAALAVNRRQAGTIPPLDVRLRELRLEIARLRAEVWDDPTFLASPTDVLQMQIDQLGDQMQDVLAKVENAPAIERR